jgi:S-adenosylmethionine:tRNA ribosyltransferase-isomerase
MSRDRHDRVEDFDYELPPELIAQRPAAERADARLLIANRSDGALSQSRYADLPELVRGDELIVLNDTRVVPARLLGHKSTGGKVELLVMGPAGPGLVRAMGRASKPIREGTRVEVGGHELTVREVCGDGVYAVALPESAGELWSFLEAHGEVPLPPYITRADGPDAEDVTRYQTVFAAHRGSVAAPTAGLHFTPALLDALRARGCETATVTLHVGPGTFLPVRGDSVAGHRMHSERYAVSEATCAAVRSARAEGRPVLAVGTTVVRTLEGVVAAHGELVPGEGETSVFIRPGWRFEVVDQLLTNFHLPRSTLLMLVSALLGRERTLRAYAGAVVAGYRFYSYGDGMWVR